MTRAPKREGLDILAMQHLPPGVWVSRREIKAAIAMDGGDLSRLMQRLMRRGWVVVRVVPQEPRKLGSSLCYYHRAEGVLPQKPRRAAPNVPRPAKLAKVVAAVIARAEPVPDVRRVCSVFDLGALL